MRIYSPGRHSLSVRNKNRQVRVTGQTRVDIGVIWQPEHVGTAFRKARLQQRPVPPPYQQRHSVFSTASRRVFTAMSCRPAGGFSSPRTLDGMTHWVKPNRAISDRR